MDVPAETYNKINGAQIRDANETLSKIAKDGVSRANIILDVGCGSGNITHMIASRIPHDRIVALDVDPAMVNFCNQNKIDESIEFVLQDISVPFDELHENIRKLEGQVDLVWSNRVLHWVWEEKRLQAMQNLYRLAKPGGRCYINTTLTIDLNARLPEAERLENEKLIKIASPEKQHQLWRGYFTDAGFKKVEVNFVERFWDLGEHYDIIGPTICFMKRYLPKDMSEVEKDKVLEGFRDLYLKSYAQPLGSPLVDNLKGISVYHYALFPIVCVK